MSLLPDRERRHCLQFYVARRLDYPVRLGIAGGFIVVGLAIQLLWTTADLPTLLWASVPLLLAGTVFLLARGYNLTPTHSLYGGKWERTTRDRFRAVREREAAVRAWDETAIDLTCWTGLFTLAVTVGAIALGFWVLVQQPGTQFWAPLFAVDAGVLVLPHWITGTRRGWKPVSLTQQITSLEYALGAIERYKDPPCMIQPMFEVAGSGEKKTPIGARVFIRFPDGPEDFYGLQFQVAINNVQGTSYPYLYAVIVAKKSFHLASGVNFNKIQRFTRGYTVEKSSERDVDAVVIRQHTTKTSGYHTDPPTIRDIARAAWEATAQILAATARPTAAKRV